VLAPLGLGAATAAPAGADSGTGSGASEQPSTAAVRPAKLTAAVAAPGVYNIAVTISSGRRTGGPVRVQIGRLRRSARTAGDGRRARIDVTLALSARAITVTARAPAFTPRLTLSMHRVRETQGAATVAPAGATGAAGATGPTGAGGATGPTGAGATAPTAPATSPAATPAATPPATAAAPKAPQFPGSAAATSASAGPVGDPGSWNLVFDDEFAATSLNASRWSTGWFDPSGISGPVNSEELECYDPSHAVVAGGELDLELTQQSETCSGQARPYASGMITTDGKFSYTYGFLEARVWLPGGSSVSDWPALWAVGQSWPQDGELDVVEGLGGQACWHFHDASGPQGGCEAAAFTAGWHTFGADWEPGTATWYYDGIPVGTVNSGITSAPMYLALDLAADDEYGGPLQAPATMRVDYVRLWQHPGGSG
jgi:beta-glucanase (GH16 family)